MEKKMQKKPETGKEKRKAPGNASLIRKSGLIHILRQLNQRQSTDSIYVVAAGVAFYGLFALFPGLTTMISLYALVSDPLEVQRQFAVMQEIIPQEAYAIIYQQIQDIVSTSTGKLSMGFGIGLALTLWGASRGMKALIMALNVAYGTEERRGFIRLNLMSMLLTVCAVLFVIISLFFIIVIPPLLSYFDFFFEYKTLIFASRWILLAVFTIFGLTLIYSYAPNVTRRKWQWFSWGAVMVTVLWLIGSYLFSYYVASFGNYNEIYGSMGAVVILLMWFYLTAYLIVVGGQLNAEIEKQATEKKYAQAGSINGKNRHRSP